MNQPLANYNERSWAIDLIGHLKVQISRNNRSVKDASGEQTIKSDGGSLFPDVLLFGDRTTARILQGWELKMPDTNIDDYEFRSNAEIKANALGLDSFLLWNVSYARLYVRKAGATNFLMSKQWDGLKDIRTRSQVIANRDRWKTLAEEILGFLNDLFDRGAIEGRQFIEAYQSGGVTALIMENSGSVAEQLKRASTKDATLRAEMTLWWDRHQGEYAGEVVEQVLSQVVISNWIGKLLFANILREKDERAHKVAEIGDGTTPTEALELFAKLSEECNFWTIFSNSLGLRELPSAVWSQLKQFNRLLSDLRVGSVDQSQLSTILESTVEVTTRKLRGQYPTPIELARLLVNLCVRDIASDRVLDPCTGSGTIPRAVIELKLSNGVTPEQVSKSVFASDQDPQALQISTFALTKPSMMNLPLRLFRYDAFYLSPELDVEFRNPSNGNLMSEKLGMFDAITSNLPFVAQAGRKKYGNALDHVISSLHSKPTSFTKRADVAAYLPFALNQLLADEGRLGIIITNAWLGTDWGDDFYRLLTDFYDLKCVITSGAGRWFQNSEVVTNILILQKRDGSSTNENDIKFVVLSRPLEEIGDDKSSKILAAQIELGQTQNDSLTIRSIRPENLNKFRPLGLGGNAQFVNCDWILDLPLVPLNAVFRVTRGERRGKNELFYPKRGHGIESEYIKPLVKSPSDFKYLKSAPIKEAFSCTRSEQELVKLGHTGALRWIERFRTDENIAKLTTKNQRWYEMNADGTTDLVMFINYGDRLFVGRVDPPSFVDQRLVPLNPYNPVDIELYHAILNSAISMFIMEGMGFGRGLGALDLNKDRIQNYMHVLDIEALSDQAISDIKAAFAPLIARPIKNVADELEESDRRKFDEVVIKAFNITVSRQTIYDSILSLVEIRRTATD